MILLTPDEAAEFLRFKNRRSVLNNKTIPRVYAGRRVRFIKEELELHLKRKRLDIPRRKPPVRSPLKRRKCD